MSKRFILLLVLTVLTKALFGFDWPVEDKTLLETFGGNKYGNYFQGIELSSTKPEVRAADAGEIVFYYNHDETYPSIPSVLGSFVVIEHEGGIKTVYGHLEKDSIRSDNVIVDKTSVIGNIGDTGYTYGKTLYFSVFDEELGNLINPLLLLPQTEDRGAPVIRDVFIKTANDQEMLLVNNATVPTGRVDLLTTVIDRSEQMEFYSPMAPFFIAVFINGEEFRTIEYESITIHEGRLALDVEETIQYGDFYVNEWNINLGSFVLNPGQSRIEIITRDINGNEASVVYSVYVAQ